MSKYKVGDKVVMEITKIFSDNFGTKDCIVKGFTRCDENCLSEHSKPLSTYTLPLEDKIHKQAAEITRLLAEIVKLKEDFKDIEPLEAKIKRQAKEITRLLIENKGLKEENKKLFYKVDSYELYGNQHEVEYNQAFNQGAEAAWGLARKINDMDIYDTEEIFIEAGAFHLGNVLENYTYPEATARVEAWEKIKEEIKVGDIVKIYEGNDNDLCVLYVSTDKKYYNAVDEYGAVYNMLTKGMIIKTGRHIDIDGFLKQIGEE